MTAHRSSQIPLIDHFGIANSVSRRRWPQVVIGALALATFVIVVTHLSEGERLLELLQRMRPMLLLAALALQVCTYACVAAGLQRALVHDDEHVPFRRLFPIALAKLFVSQALPSIGLSGNLMVLHSLQRCDISRATAVRAVLASMFGYFLSFSISLMATILILWIMRELNAAILAPLTFLCLIMLGASVAVLLLRERTPQILPPRIRQWLIQKNMEELLEESVATQWSTKVLIEVTLLQLAVFLLDAATLDVGLHSIGVAVPFPVAIAALVSAEAVASIGLVPGGLGTFEGTCVAVLHAHGISIEAALTGTIILRGLIFWLPMLPGLWLTRREFDNDSFDYGPAHMNSHTMSRSTALSGGKTDEKAI